MPSALAQGSLSASVLARQAAVWGGELRAAGFNLDLAPVMDVVPAGTADRNQSPLRASPPRRRWTAPSSSAYPLTPRSVPW
jgi:beta-N-acetylhexosaminidase